MVWDDQKDDLLVREMFLYEPHQFKPRSRERGAAWRSIAESLCTCQAKYFKVDARAVRERVGVIIAKHHQKMVDEEAASGISPEHTELDDAIEELSKKIEEYESKHLKNVQENKSEEDTNKLKATEMRTRAVESLGETMKRKASENTPTKKKKRSSGSDTICYLREKSEKEQELKALELKIRREELDLRKREFEALQQQNNNLLLLLLQNQNTNTNMNAVQQHES